MFSMVKLPSPSKTCDPTWTLFNDDYHISSFHFLVKLCNRIYIHLLIITLGILNFLLTWAYQEPFPYIVGMYSSILVLPISGIVNLYACLRRKDSYDKTLWRAVYTAKKVSGENYCSIKFVLLGHFILLMLCMSPLANIHKSAVWFLANLLIWVTWSVYNVCHMARFCLDATILQFIFQRMRSNLSVSGATGNLTCDQINVLLIYSDELIEISKEIDNHHGIKNTCNIIFVFLTLLGNTFCSIGYYMEWIMKVNGTHQITFTITLAAWNSLLIGIVALLIYCCSRVSSEAEKFNEVLSSLVIRDKTASLVSNPYVTAHFAIGKKLKFSACGCFYIDYRLGYSMLAACITYLVILIEFDNRNGSTPLELDTPAPTVLN